MLAFSCFFPTSKTVNVNKKAPEKSDALKNFYGILFDLVAAPFDYGEALTLWCAEELRIDLDEALCGVPGHEYSDHGVGFRSYGKLGVLVIGLALEADHIVSIVLHLGNPELHELLGFAVVKSQLRKHFLEEGLGVCTLDAEA